MILIDLPPPGVGSTGGGFFMSWLRVNTKRVNFDRIFQPYRSLHELLPDFFCGTEYAFPCFTQKWFRGVALLFSNGSHFLFSTSSFCHNNLLIFSRLSQGLYIRFDLNHQSTKFHWKVAQKGTLFVKNSDVPPTLPIKWQKCMLYLFQRNT